MTTVSFLFIYDDTITQGAGSSHDLLPEKDGVRIEGVTNIDLHGNPALYKRFTDKGVTLGKLPIIVISYQGVLKQYPYNDHNMEKIKNEIQILLNKA